jgi:hypothetical protein
MLAENRAFSDFSSCRKQLNPTSITNLIGLDVATFERRAMFKIEKLVEGNTTVLRLVGRINAEHLDELSKLIDEVEPGMVKLDLSEVTLVDLDVVHFLGEQERRGLHVSKCSRYVREWIKMEETANSMQRKDDPESRERQ